MLQMVYDGNVFLKNNGDETFTDVAIQQAQHLIVLVGEPFF